MEDIQFDGEIEQLIEQAQKQDVDIDSMEIPTRTDVIQQALEEYVHSGWPDVLLKRLEGRDIDDNEYHVSDDGYVKLYEGRIDAQSGKYEITVPQVDASVHTATFEMLKTAVDTVIDNHEVLVASQGD